MRRAASLSPHPLDTKPDIDEPDAVLPTPPPASDSDSDWDFEIIEDEDEDIKPSRKRAASKSKTQSGSRKPAAKKGKGSGGGGRSWTGEEYVALFNHVVLYGAKRSGMHTAVEGRTANQCAMAWRDVVAPACKAALLAKAGQRRR